MIRGQKRLREHASELAQALGHLLARGGGLWLQRGIETERENAFALILERAAIVRLPAGLQQAAQMRREAVRAVNE